MRYDWSCFSCSSNFGYRGIVRRVQWKMDRFLVVQRKRKRNSSRESDFCKRDRNDTTSCSESASQVFSSEKDIGNFVGVPWLMLIDERYCLIAGPLLQVSGFHMQQLVLKKFPEAMVKRNYMVSVQSYLQRSFFQMVRCVCSSDCQS